MAVTRVGLLYNARIRAAADLARALDKLLTARGHESWLRPLNSHRVPADFAKGTGLIVSVGGDGTILRSARLAVPLNIPILGVNMGKVGFMTELSGAVALERVPAYLETPGWTEERTVVAAEVVREGEAVSLGDCSWALNEVVVGRGASARLVSVDASIDGTHLTSYRADGVIVATATGSTAYALAAGGPVLDPQSKELLLLPVSPYLCLANPIVVHEDAVVELTVGPQHEAMVSLDGQVEYPLRPGDRIRARRSGLVARFLRAQPRAYFYATLTQRLNVGGSGEPL